MAVGQSVCLARLRLGVARVDCVDQDKIIARRRCRAGDMHASFHPLPAEDVPAAGNYQAKSGLSSGRARPSEHSKCAVSLDPAAGRRQQEHGAGRQPATSAGLSHIETSVQQTHEQSSSTVKSRTLACSCSRSAAASGRKRLASALEIRTERTGVSLRQMEGAREAGKRAASTHLPGPRGKIMGRAQAPVRRRPLIGSRELTLESSPACPRPEPTQDQARRVQHGGARS